MNRKPLLTFSQKTSYFKLQYSTIITAVKVDSHQDYYLLITILLLNLAALCKNWGCHATRNQFPKKNSFNSSDFATFDGK